MALVGLLSLLTTSLQAQEETLTYHLYANKAKVGKWVVSRYEEGGQTIYESRREIVFKLIKSMRTVTTQRAVYRDAQLQSFDMSVAVNGEHRRNIRIERRDGRYRFEVDDKEPRWWEAPVLFSHLCLFFDSPEGQDALLIERLGEFRPVRQLDTNSFALTLPNGEENEYHYLDGRLSRATLEDGILHTYVRLKQVKTEPVKNRNGKTES